MFPRRLIVVEDQAIQPAKQAPVCVIEHVLGDYTTSHLEVVSYGTSLPKYKSVMQKKISYKRKSQTITSTNNFYLAYY